MELFDFAYCPSLERKLALIPIYLTNAETPDLALALSREENSRRYIGRTCLTMEMAYNNARLIVRPDSDWLKP